MKLLLTGGLLVVSIVATTLASGQIAIANNALKPLFAQIPISGDTLTAGAMIAAAVWALASMKSDLEKKQSEGFEKIDDRIDRVRDSIADVNQKVSLLIQETEIKYRSYLEEKSSFHDAIVYLKGRTSVLEMQTRDITNWIQSRGADFAGRSGWKVTNDS